MTTNPPSITPVLLRDGRTAYQVGDAIVLDPQDAMDLLTDTAAPSRCLLAQQATQLRTWYEMRVITNPILGERQAVAGLVANGEWTQL